MFSNSIYRPGAHVEIDEHSRTTTTIPETRTIHYLIEDSCISQDWIAVTVWVDPARIWYLAKRKSKLHTYNAATRLGRAADCQPELPFGKTTSWQNRFKEKPMWKNWLLWFLFLILSRIPSTKLAPQTTPQKQYKNCLRRTYIKWNLV